MFLTWREAMNSTFGLPTPSRNNSSCVADINDTRNVTEDTRNWNLVCSPVSKKKTLLKK
jgi:hypothetical protein